MQGEKNLFIEFLKKQSGLSFSGKFIDVQNVEAINFDENKLINALKEKINDDNLVRFSSEEERISANKKIINDVQSEILAPIVKKNSGISLPSFNVGLLSRHLATSLVAVSIVLLFVSISMSSLKVSANQQKSAQAEQEKVKNFILENSRNNNQRGVVAGVTEENQELNQDNQETLREYLIKKLNLPQMLENTLINIFLNNK